MKIALTLLLSFATAAIAQPAKPEKTPARDALKAGAEKRLGSVTWDLKAHKLIWVVETGSEIDGEFAPSSSDKYEISPDNAVMAFSDEKRGFAGEEARSLRQLLDVLSLYCAESTLWWDDGQGVPVDGTESPGDSKKPAEAAPKPSWVDTRRPKPALRDLEIAALAGVR